MRIILNADDFGFDDDTTAATIECFEWGGLTSATIMAGMPAVEAAARWAADHPEHSFGAHLTWGGDGPEPPVSDPATIPDLVDDAGRLAPSNELRMRALRGRLDVDQIAAETEAQLARLADLGVRLSHVDSHGHLHKFAPFRAALDRVLPRHGIERVRSVQNLYLARPWRSPTFWLGGRWRRSIRRRWTTTDDFYMPGSAMDVGWTDALLARLGPPVRTDRRTLEIGVHPGTAETWRADEGRDCIAFGERARAAGHALVTWNDVG